MPFSLHKGPVCLPSPGHLPGIGTVYLQSGDNFFKFSPQIIEVSSPKGIVSLLLITAV